MKTMMTMMKRIRLIIRIMLWRKIPPRLVRGNSTIMTVLMRKMASLTKIRRKIPRTRGRTQEENERTRTSSTTKPRTKRPTKPCSCYKRTSRSKHNKSNHATSTKTGWQSSSKSTSKTPEKHDFKQTIHLTTPQKHST